MTTPASPAGVLLTQRLYDPAGLKPGANGDAIVAAHGGLFLYAVDAAGGSVVSINETSGEALASFHTVAEALRAATMIQHRVPAEDPWSPRLQVACGIHLEREGDVTEKLFPLKVNEDGGRIVVSDAARAALDDGTRSAFDWSPERRGRFRTLYWDERFTLLNAPFERAFAAETTEWIEPMHTARGRPHPLPYPERPDVRNELVGFALGGGGMRAAVFSLGVAQALSRGHFLRDVDYVTGVSGGGYLGASLQSLMAEDLPYDGLQRFDTTRESFPFAFPRPSDESGETATSTGHAVHGTESPALRYIREHAQFLGRSLGLFDAYTWRMVGQVLFSMALLWVLFLLPAAALVGILGMWFRGEYQQLNDDWQRGLTLFTLGVAAVAWLLAWPASGRLGKFLRWPLRVLTLGSIILAVAVVMALASSPVDKTSFDEWARTIAILSPLLLFALCGVIVTVIEWVAMLRDKSTATGPWGRLTEGTSTYFSRLAAALAVVLGIVGAIWALDSFVYDQRLSTAEATTIAVIQVGGFAIAIASIRKLLAPFEESARNFLGSQLPKLALAVGGYIALGLALASGFWGLWWLWSEGHRDWCWVIAGLSAGLLLLFGLWGWLGFRTLNWLAPHRLYADLIDESWIVGARPPQNAAVPASRVRQWSRVWKRPDITLGSLHHGPQATHMAPYPLVCTTLNIPASRGPTMPDRVCDSFVLAPRNSGSALTRWSPTDDQPDIQGMRLARAAAISGAAVSPGMGFSSNRTLSIIFTLFNVRLGQWVRNPRGSGRGRVRSWVNSLPLALYWKEMLGLSSHDDGQVYLSDGEHFEGLGVYELLRRRCKYIVAIAADIEGGKDQPLRFGKLASTLRLARVDFGVEIEFAGLAPMMRDPKAPEFSSSYFAAGTIRYPSSHGHSDEGVFIIIKSALVERTLPADIVNYMRAVDPGFPNFPTQDLQYDLAQFESLRQLGYIAGTAVSKAGGVSSDAARAETVAQRFERVLATYKKLCDPDPMPTKVEVVSIPAGVAASANGPSADMSQASTHG